MRVGGSTMVVAMITIPVMVMEAAATLYPELSMRSFIFAHRMKI